jgi:HD-like signal output (HDOD) protein
MTKYEIINAIDREVDNLPPIPQNINKIRELIHNPNSSITHIADFVKTDPSLTANLLRIANSAWYAVISRIDTVKRAITTIGLKQLGNLLLTIGAKKVMSERYESMEEIWEISHRCAFYSQSIMKIKSKNADNLESAYTVGLLHNIGKIILLTLSPDLMSKIGTLSEKKNMDEHTVERLALGVTTAEIGGKITERWNFPRHISNTISNQDTPKLPDEEEKLLTYTVYLAKTLVNYNPLEEVLLEKIEPKVAEFFELDSEEQIKKLSRSLEQFYNRLEKTTVR